jgi:hypothetical protein
VVFVDTPTYLPDAWLVVLSPIDGHSKEVIRAVVESANGRPLAFLYLAPQAPQQAPPRLFEIQTRFGLDKQAQKVLSRAKRAATATNTPAKYFYAVGGAAQVFDIARKIRPEEIVAEEHTAKRISGAIRAKSGMAVSPEYVRYQVVDGVQIAHNVLHELYAHAAHAPGVLPSPATGRTLASSASAGSPSVAAPREPPVEPHAMEPTSPRSPATSASAAPTDGAAGSPRSSTGKPRTRRRHEPSSASDVDSSQSTLAPGESASVGRDPAADNANDRTPGTPGPSSSPAERPRQ